MTPPNANDRPDPEPTQAGPPSTRLEPMPAESFAHWRSRVLHRLLLVIAVLGSVAYVPSIWAAALAITLLVQGLRSSMEEAERANRELRAEQSRLSRAHEELVASVAERKRAEERLRHSEQLTAIGTLAGGIAHDFNNLLTPILSGLELLRNRSRDQTASWDPEVEEVLPVLLFSGVVVDEVQRRARKAGCRHGASKPFELQELATVVRKALGEAAKNAAP